MLISERVFLNTVSLLTALVGKYDFIEETFDYMSHSCVTPDDRMREEFNEFRASLESEHPLAVMIREHDTILGFLARLRELNHYIQQFSGYNADLPEFSELIRIATNLIEAEPHHKREEDVLFPRLEQQGVHGPTYVMRSEHVELRSAKHRLSELAKSVSTTSFEVFQKQLHATSDYLASALESHILKENYILYPIAFQVLDTSLWNVMKKECDSIGNCSFMSAA